MKKLFSKIVDRWVADTPVIARFAQIVSGAIGSVFALWATMPEEFKCVFSPFELKLIAVVGVVSVVLLQLTKTKDHENK